MQNHMLCCNHDFATVKLSALTFQSNGKVLSLDLIEKVDPMMKSWWTWWEVRTAVCQGISWLIKLNLLLRPGSRAWSRKSSCIVKQSWKHCAKHTLQIACLFCDLKSIKAISEFASHMQHIGCNNHVASVHIYKRPCNVHLHFAKASTRSSVWR